MPLLLDEATVRQLLPMEDLIDTMSSALGAFSRREVTQPLRTVLEVGEKKAFYGVMPAYLPTVPALGTKLVTVFGSNAERGLPSHLALIVLLSPETGELLALVDGRYITEARTAAVSAVSVQHLAKADAPVLAVIGSGVQARSHVEAIARVRRLKEIRAWSPTKAKLDAFISEMHEHTTASLTAAGSAREAVTGADIVVLVTASKVPVIQSEWIADGTHICAVGACRPTEREMDPALVARAELYVDSREGALKEAGDIVLAMKEGVIDASHIRGELGEVVNGTLQGRTSDRSVTIFKSLGMAVEDVAAAALVYRRAIDRGIGQEVKV